MLLQGFLFGWFGGIFPLFVEIVVTVAASVLYVSPL